MRLSYISSLLPLLVSASTSFTIPVRLARDASYSQVIALKQAKKIHRGPTEPINAPVPTENVEFSEDETWKQRVEMDHFFEEIEQDRRELSKSSTPIQSQQDKDVRNARILLLTAAALYGTNFSVVKLLGEVMPVGAMGTLRFGLAALVTLPWLLAKPRPDSDLRTTANAAFAGLEVGMWASVGYVAQAVGLETTTASKSAFLCSLAVVIVPLLDRIMGKKLSLKQIAGAAMAVAGVAFLELGGGPLESFSSSDIASLIQPFAFGLGFWKMEQAMRVHPEEASRSTAAQLLAIFVASATYCLAADGLPDSTQIMAWLMDPMILAALLWTGAITTALTVYMETLALKTLSAADTTLIFSTEPLWGAAFASVVMGEHFGPTAIAGGALILAGCLVSNLGIDGIRNMVQPPVNEGNTMGRLTSSGVAGALGAWVSSWSNSGEIVQSGELDEIVEEVISKAHDVL